DENKPKQLNTWLISALSIAAFSGILFFTFKNYQKMGENIKDFAQKAVNDEIKEKIANAQSQEDKDKAIKELIKIFKQINITEEDARVTLEGINGVSSEEANSIVEKLVDEREHIFAQAPEALGGVAEKIQYYCYINEERGHLYNWILNPENQWNKYLFISFCIVSSIGYLARTAADAVKQVAVSRENSKSELNLRKRLVEVEINNFKAKKLSAINPMIDNYNYQKKKGKSKEELTSIAQNVLLEIKNGPPYIYN
ncbi:hypothetical protein IJ531_05920, partial [bacterium]|nr:hypothetical protein [bacterium]